MYPMRTRFLNLFGNPSNIGCAGTICRCNTVAMNYALLGMANSRSKLPNLKCLVIDGCNLSGTAPLDFQRLKKRMGQGDLKLIVIERRPTPAASPTSGSFASRHDTGSFMAWIT